MKIKYGHLLPGARLGAMCVFITVSLIAISAAPAHRIVGTWQGNLDTGRGTLRVVIHILRNKERKLTGTIDSPGQSAFGIPITSVTFSDPDFRFEARSIGSSYQGKMSRDHLKITGRWQQGGGSLSLVLRRAGK